MTTVTRTKIIEERLRDAFSPSHLEVIDESDQHVGHAGHQGGGRHFAVIIHADCLQALSLVAAHRQIYAVVDDMMPAQIHALRIKLL